MKIIKKITVAIFFFLSVFTGWVAITGIGMEETVLTSEYYWDLIESGRFSAGFYGEIKNALSSELARELQVRELEGELGSLIRDTLDIKWAEQQFFTSAEDIISLMRGEQDELSHVIDMSEINIRFRENLAGAPPETRGKLEDFELPREIPLADVFRALRFPENIETQLAGSRSPLRVRAPYFFLAVFLAGFFILSGFKVGLGLFGFAITLSGISYYFFLYLAGNALRVLPGSVERDLVAFADALIFVFNYTASSFASAAFGFAVSGIILVAASVIAAVLSVVLRRSS